MSLPYLTIIEVFAAISCGASLAIVLTFLIFPHLRKKLLVQFVFYISISDFLGNVGYVPASRPDNGTMACYVESYLNLAAYPSSWWWTLVMIAMLYYLAHYGRLPHNVLIYAHLIAWGVPAIFFFISLPFTKLGRQDTFYNYEVCNYYGPLGAEVYHIITYYGQFFFILGCLLYMRWKIHQLEKLHDIRSFQQSFVITKKSLYFYYNIFLIAWLPHIVLAIALYFVHTDDALEDMRILYFLTTWLKIMHGFVTAVVFFARSQEIRELWYDKVFRHLMCKSICKLCFKPAHGFNSSSTVRGHQELDVFMQDFISTDRNSAFLMDEEEIGSNPSPVPVNARGSVVQTNRASSLYQPPAGRASSLYQPPAVRPTEVTAMNNSEGTVVISEESWTLPVDYGIPRVTDVTRGTDESRASSRHTLNAMHQQPDNNAL